MKIAKIPLLFALATILVLPIQRVTAQTEFTVYDPFPDHVFPTGSPVINYGNTLYGVTSYGGSNGMGNIYWVGTNGSTSTYTDIHSFRTNVDDGIYPAAGLLLSDGELYGTTSSSYVSGEYGTIFKIATNGGFMVLHKFTDATNDGANPFAPLILSGGMLYGTTVNGGVNGYGCIFKISTTGSFKVLYSFIATVSGAAPYGRLLLNDGILYGTASADGTNLSWPCGTVFSYNLGSSNFTVLHTFSSAEGSFPLGSLVLSGSTLFGTVNTGCTNNAGAVFSVGTSSPYPFGIVHAFGSGGEGKGPVGDLLLWGSGEELLGVTDGGTDSAYGSVYQIGTDGSGYTTLAASANYNEAPNGILLTTSGTQNIAYVTSTGSLGTSLGALFGIYGLTP